MKRKFSFFVAIVMMLTVMFSSSALAHDNSGNGKQWKHSWKTKTKLTYAQGVQMIVKDMQLNIDNIRFIKEPKASDYFTGVPDKASYAHDFIVAHLNGLTIPKDVKPDKNITREQYANLLAQAIQKKGDFPLIKMYIEIADQKEINPDYSSNIQMLLITKIAELDKKQRFLPKADIGKTDASSMLKKAVQFVKDRTPGNTQSKVTLSVQKVNDQINKVVVSWGEKPNAGYRVTIDRIDFKDKKAIISYTLHEPEKGKNYAQVVTEAKAETYVSSAFNPVLAESAANAGSK